MNPLYEIVASRANYRCEYCKAPEQVFNFPFNVDHIHPVSKGGNNDPENLALACESCNLYKSDFVDGIDSNTNLEVMLFNPRVDGWKVHFEFRLTTGELVGITPTGRATIKRLNFNSDFHIRARKHWARISVYP